MKRTIPDTTCAIMTRDSRMNAAGGIELNVRTLLPFFDRIEVYDTGSIDGSRQDLDRIKAQNLFVYDLPWKGFADTRNDILDRIRTRRVFFIDDDELPGLNKIDQLVDLVEANPSTGAYWFTFAQFLKWPSKPYFTSVDEVVAYRLFDVNGAKYVYGLNKCYEDVEFENERTHLKAPIKMLHFLPSSEARGSKEQLWYQGGHHRFESPHENAKRLGWKEFNQWRLQYPLPEGLDIDRYLTERGVDTTRIIPCKFVDLDRTEDTTK